MSTSRILFVCLGNICRSPAAEGVFRARAEQAGLLTPLEIDSAGTGDWHVGHAPDERMQQAAKRRGYALEALRARQVTAQDLDNFDLIFAMDEQNLKDLRAMASNENAAAKIQLFLNLAPDLAEHEVPDPYYGGPDGFDHVLDLIETASDALLKRLGAQ
ncbi:protein-tyrosine-phosphatase [Terasakiispira papahanaumokuakeensis]|uniref:protein-tyrosine-phosphatase n=1 Tax=Terasakiispira papahanaumokuakeensis TaxID=197479 RepID=A0A1E2V810_9GAMM|nr:low molecular weight protein-tyrosine-phosphatase [Terasakiispira papahanaumokuakeensis]ODC02976.1 protein-tyrosine-phosphatase [Terasakiispira papahanaumokuakeensis]